MIILRDFLENNVLIRDTHNIINYDYFKCRFVTVFGNWSVRDDITPLQICAATQNAIDINIPYLTTIFKNTLDPFKTWGESGENSETGNNTHDTTDKDTITLTRTGGETATINRTGGETSTINRTGGETTSTKRGGTETTVNNGDSNSTTTTDTTTNNLRNSFNSATATPTDNSINKVDGTVTNNYTDNSTVTRDLTDNETATINTQDETATTRNTQDETTANKTRKETAENTVKNNYTKSGYTAASAIEIMSKYQSAYDIIINLIAPLVLNMYINIWE